MTDTTDSTRTTDATGAPDRALLTAALRAYGRNATSFQLLERDFRVWARRVPAHRRRPWWPTSTPGSAWVAGGEPLAPAEGIQRVAQAASSPPPAAAGRRASFFATRGTSWRVTTGRSPAVLLLGEQPVWDPQEWTSMVRVPARCAPSSSGAGQGGARSAVRRADVAPGRRAPPRARSRWCAAGRPPGPWRRWGFWCGVEPFTDAEARRMFVAEREGEIVALLSMAPVYARDGWLFEDLLRDPSAPNGTSELLVDAGMRAHRRRGLSLGHTGAGAACGRGGTAGCSRVRRVGDAVLQLRGAAQLQGQAAPGALGADLAGAPRRRVTSARAARRAHRVRRRFAGAVRLADVAARTTPGAARP